MTNVVRAANHEPIMEGKNLAVVMRYARISPVVIVRIRRSVTDITRSIVEYEYDDGATCVTYWNDWRVALRWLRARRSWSVDRVLVADGMYDAMALETPATLKAIRDRGTLVLDMS